MNLFIHVQDRKKINKNNPALRAQTTHISLWIALQAKFIYFHYRFDEQSQA